MLTVFVLSRVKATLLLLASSTSFCVENLKVVGRMLQSEEGTKQGWEDFMAQECDLLMGLL